MAGLCAGLVSPLAWIGLRKRKDPDLQLVLTCWVCRAQYDPISEREQFWAHYRKHEKEWSPKYLAACTLANVPWKERGNICVAEVRTEHEISDARMCINGMLFNTGISYGKKGTLTSWKARRFEDLKAGDVFRTIYPNGYECNPKTNEPAIFRADTDAQVDPNNPQNAGLTGMRLNWSATNV